MKKKVHNNKLHSHFKSWNVNTQKSPAATSNKILCIGEALIDMICVDKGKSLSAGDNFLKKTGGAPTNVAAAISALGGNRRESWY
jgi:hypothetical protein